MVRIYFPRATLSQPAERLMAPSPALRAQLGPACSYGSDGWTSIWLRARLAPAADAPHPSSPSWPQPRWRYTARPFNRGTQIPESPINRRLNGAPPVGLSRVYKYPVQRILYAVGL
eukprot:9495640-Pyramimonas_sp.AAC.1